MSDKTVVEKLREAAKHAREEKGLPVYTPDQLEKLADAIEREYLPRPRFDDGEPVQFGDEFYSDEHDSTYKTTMFVLYADGSYRVNQAGCNACQYEPGERVKRLKPEVLDDDGVPIRVRDHVWFKQGTHYDGVEYVVTEITKTQVHYKNSESEYPKGECSHYCASSNLTHKQPDSLERIEEDAEKSVCEYFGRKIGDCENCEGFGRCREKMTRDLLRRQRNILERDSNG